MHADNHWGTSNSQEIYQACRPQWSRHPKSSRNCCTAYAVSVRRKLWWWCKFNVTDMSPYVHWEYMWRTFLTRGLRMSVFQISSISKMMRYASNVVNRRYTSWIEYLFQTPPQSPTAASREESRKERELWEKQLREIEEKEQQAEEAKKGMTSTPASYRLQTAWTRTERERIQKEAAEAKKRCVRSLCLMG